MNLKKVKIAAPLAKRINSNAIYQYFKKKFNVTFNNKQSRPVSAKGTFNEQRV